MPDPAVPKQLKLISLRSRQPGQPDPHRQAVHNYLKENGVPRIWHVNGNAHDTTEWDDNLSFFCQRSFKMALY